MKIELTNLVFLYRPDEIRRVENCLAAAVCVLKKARLEANNADVIMNIDFALNKLVCDIPNALCITAISYQWHPTTK